MKTIRCITTDPDEVLNQVKALRLAAGAEATVQAFEENLKTAGVELSIAFVSGELQQLDVPSDSWIECVVTDPGGASSTAVWISGHHSDGDVLLMVHEYEAADRALVKWERKVASTVLQSRRNLTNVSSEIDELWCRTFHFDTMFLRPGGHLKGWKAERIGENVYRIPKAGSR